MQPLQLWPMPRYSLISTVKDEGPYLLEWLAYYHVIGYNHFHISANDCADGTDQILSLLDQQGMITYNENSIRLDGEPPDPQRRAYFRARADKAVHSANYALIADGDEFWNIHAGKGRLKDLFKAAGKFDVLSAPWHIFGNSGETTFKDRLVMDQFTHSARPMHPPNGKFWAIKSMFRPKQTKWFGVHRPFLLPRNLDGRIPTKWLNGSGVDITEHIANSGWRFTRPIYGDALVQMNHYMVRSSEAFLMKRLRGTANSAEADRISFDYFQNFNCNDIKDPSLKRHSDAVADQLQSWFDDIPGLRDLHKSAVQHHKKKIAAVRPRVVENHPEIAKELGFDIV